MFDGTKLSVEFEIGGMNTKAVVFKVYRGSLTRNVVTFLRILSNLLSFSEINFVIYSWNRLLEKVPKLP